MGGGSLDSKTFKDYSTSYAGKKTEEVFTSRRLDNLLNPHGVKIRESRDSLITLNQMLLSWRWTLPAQWA